MRNQILNTVLRGRSSSRSDGQQAQQAQAEAPSAEQDNAERSESASHAQDLPSYGEAAPSTGPSQTAPAVEAGTKPTQSSASNLSGDPFSQSSLAGIQAHAQTQALLSINPQTGNEANTPAETTGISIRNPQSLLTVALTFYDAISAATLTSSRGQLHDTNDNDEPQIVTIFPHRQLLYIDIHNHTPETFAEHSTSVKLPSHHRNHWVVSNTPKPGIAPNISSSGHAPQPLRVPRFTVGPDVLAFWASASTNPVERDSTRYIHILTIEGLNGPMIRKYLAISTITHALSIIFQELANGYSIVFVAVMLKSEWNASLTAPRKRFAQCSTVSRLEAYQDPTSDNLNAAEQLPTYESVEKDGKKDFGIIF